MVDDFLSKTNDLVDIMLASAQNTAHLKRTALPVEVPVDPKTMKYAGKDVHVLKTDGYYFDLVASMAKTCEIRKDDRTFKQGDYIVLRRLKHDTRILQRDFCIVKIGYVLRSAYVLPGYVCLSLLPVSRKEYSAIVEFISKQNWSGNGTTRFYRYGKDYEQGE